MGTRRRLHLHLNGGVDGVCIHGGATFVSNTRDEACPSYYTDNNWFENIGNSLLYRLLPKILDTMRCFGL